MTDAPIPNVLAARYASPEMVRIWAPEGRIREERRFWIAVLTSQADLGIPVPDGVIARYEAAVDTVDLDSIRRREAVTRHDVKARIEEFNALAGAEHIHKGLTSRDLTENVEQLQVRRSLQLVRDRMLAALSLLAARAAEYGEVVIAGRTHNVPAQATTVGKRFANAGQELLAALEHLDDLLARQPLRGLKGPVGTQQDLLDLFDGDASRVESLEDHIARLLGFPRTLKAVGQVYPRSLDLEVVSTYVQVAAAASSLATTLRLMAGADLLGEGFAAGQVGSSAMPHKVNARSSERITGFMTILRGHLTMAAALAGDQWNEGDVSCSIVRRVVLPDSSFAIDGLLETFLTVLAELDVRPASIARELDDQLPFLATTKLLMGAVKAGMGREEAHERIKRHALAATASLRAGGANTFLADVADDPGLPIDGETAGAMLSRPLDFTGLATSQVATFVSAVERLVAANPAAATYRPAGIL